MPTSHHHASRVVILHGRAAAMEIPSSFERAWVAAARYGLERVHYEHAACVPIQMPFYGSIWRPDEHVVEPTFDDGTGKGVRELFPEIKLPDFGRAIESAFEWIDRKTGGSGKVLKHLLTDTREYLERSDLRAETDKVVRDACAGPGEVVLVGFSMGSLIAYNVVAHADETSPVKSLVTCGSPIGDPGFLKYVTQVAPKQTLAFPNGLRMWVNIWNDDDPATQVHELTPLFPDLRKEPEKPLREIQATPTRGRGPGPLNPAAAHNGPDYLSSKALGAAVKAALLAAGSGRAPV